MIKNKLLLGDIIPIVVALCPLGAPQQFVLYIQDSLDFHFLYFWSLNKRSLVAEQ